MSQTRDPHWIGLSEASRLLGVSPATVRRWSDAGHLRVFTTPGGHRRFRRDGLERLLPANRSHRPLLDSAGFAATRIARTYRRATNAVSRALPWVLDLTDEQRRLFRGRGRILTAHLLRYLDASDTEAAGHHLDESTRSATEYGRAAAVQGLSLSQTVEGFLRFRMPFHHELAVVARRRGFDTRETTDLLEAAESAMDGLLVATMHGHAEAAQLDGEHQRQRRLGPVTPGTRQ